jgi:lipopolysaccharide/colanic/teichoic acid biosynthesis glycosyltransferase
MIYSKYIKVCGDKLIAGILGILLLPLFVLIFVLLLMTQGKPVCFVQRRSGMYQRTFKLYKFRTLNPPISGDLRMTNRVFTFFGYFMRRYGIDELPQFLNIIKGEMSFIGPRPMPVEYDSKYSQIQLNRFNVKPGITGWAQVHGRNNISWVQRFELDLRYVNNVSLFMDIKIIWMTFVQIIESVFGKDKKQVEMPVFTGFN